MLSGQFDRRPGKAAVRERGAALIEVLVSILIVSFGLLALAGLQTKMNSALLEAYQRAQALTVLEDMTQRIQANQNQSANYVAASLGTGDGGPRIAPGSEPGFSSIAASGAMPSRARPK